MKHTSTPWTYSDYHNDDGTVSYFLQSSDEKQAIAELYVQPEAKGNADLIISCVNACEGIENLVAIKELIEAAKPFSSLAGFTSKDVECLDQALANLEKEPQ